MHKSPNSSTLDHFQSYSINLSPSWVSTLPSDLTLQQTLSLFCTTSLSLSTIPPTLPQSVPSTTLSSPILCSLISLSTLTTPPSPSSSPSPSPPSSPSKYLSSTAPPPPPPSSTRMLKLIMTTGKDTITCIEIKEIGFMSSDMEEGSIFLLKPPMEVRRGVFLLNEDNVDVIYMKRGGIGKEGIMGEQGWEKWGKEEGKKRKKRERKTERVMEMEEVKLDIEEQAEPEKKKRGRKKKEN